MRDRSPGKAVVTGAGGFVGSAIAVGLAEVGWGVTGLDLAFDAEAAERLTGVTCIESDLARTLPDVSSADLIVHAAAVTTEPGALGWTAADHLAANLRPLIALLEAAADSQALFVFLSSSGVFAAGDDAGLGALTDQSVPSGENPYAVAKRTGEILTVTALPKARAYVLRLGYIYGPHEQVRRTRQRPSPVARLIAEARGGGPLYVPVDNPERDWTWAGDIGPAIDRLVRDPSTGKPVHLNSGEVLRDGDVASMLCDTRPSLHVSDAPAAGAKAPMAPSEVPALESFRWTRFKDGLSRLVD